MKTETIDAAIEEMTGQIAALQDGISALNRVKNGTTETFTMRTAPTSPDVPTLKRGKRIKGLKRRNFVPVARVGADGTPTGGATNMGAVKPSATLRNPAKAIPPTPPAARSTAATVSAIDKLDKPTTIGGAMKLIIRTAKAPFGLDHVRESLKADADWAKLLAESSDSAVNANWSYWLSKGKIEACAGGFRIAEPEFFAP